MKMSPLLSLAAFAAVAFLPAAAFPWSGAAPDELVREAVEPDLVAHETPCDWRPVVTPMAEALVSDCGSAREAVLTLAAKLPEVSGVYYSTERRKAAMNALEALDEKKVSCTGQSIFLICALRSVGIPARMVGLLTWNHVLGNHTWVEAWFDGEWHMIEYNEHDFNTPWVMENIGMLDPKEITQRIQAVTPSGDEPFLTVYVLDKRVLPSVNVSERYARLAQEWYDSSGSSADAQRLMVDCMQRPDHAVDVRIETAAGECISADALPTTQDDMRRFARLSLPRDTETVYFLRIGEEEERIPLHCTPAPVQILRLK